MNNKDDFVVDDTLFQNNETANTTKSSNVFSSKDEYVRQFKLNKFHVDDLNAKLYMEYMHENDSIHKNDDEYKLKRKTMESIMNEQMTEKQAIGHGVTDFMKLGDILKKYDPTFNAKSIDEYENQTIYIIQLKCIENNFSKDPNKEEIVKGFQIFGYDKTGNDIVISTFIYQVKKTCQLLLENVKHVDGKFEVPIECKVVPEFKKRPNKYNDWYKTYKLLGVNA